MDGNSAKKVPILDRLVDTPGKPAKTPLAPNPQPQQPQTVKPVLASTHGVGQANSTETNTATSQIITPPKNRRTDKSQFEIELTEIVNKIMLKHFHNASEEIVTEVLREVRARLPGQRKD